MVQLEPGSEKRQNGAPSNEGHPFEGSRLEAIGRKPRTEQEWRDKPATPDIY